MKRSGLPEYMTWMFVNGKRYARGRKDGRGHYFKHAPGTEVIYKKREIFEQFSSCWATLESRVQSTISELRSMMRLLYPSKSTSEN